MRHGETWGHVWLKHNLLQWTKNFFTERQDIDTSNLGEFRKIKNIHPWTEVMTVAVLSEEARVKIQY